MRREARRGIRFARFERLCQRGQQAFPDQAAFARTADTGHDDQPVQWKMDGEVLQIVRGGGVEAEP